MSSKDWKRGPAMDWLTNPKVEAHLKAFRKAFFNDDRKRYWSFKSGAYRVSPDVALHMCEWWQQRGFAVRLHHLRPDLYGPKDVGPEK